MADQDQSDTTPDYGYGPRWDESRNSYVGVPKGLGYFGPLKNASGQTESEFSLDREIDGKLVSMPSIVPTLTKAQLQQMLAAKEGTPLPAGVEKAAIAHAKQRIAAGKSPFAGPGEQQSLYPELIRNPVPIIRPMPKVMGRTGQPQTPEMEQILLQRLMQGQR